MPLTIYISAGTFGLFFFKFRVQRDLNRAQAQYGSYFAHLPSGFVLSSPHTQFLCVMATVRAQSNDWKFLLSISVSLGDRGFCVQDQKREQSRGNKNLIYAGVNAAQHSSNLLLPVFHVLFFVFYPLFSPELFLSVSWCSSAPHQSTWNQLNTLKCVQFPCWLKQLLTVCVLLTVLWSGISCLWLGVVDPSSQQLNKADLRLALVFQEMLSSDLQDQISNR